MNLGSIQGLLQLFGKSPIHNKSDGSVTFLDQLSDDKIKRQRLRGYKEGLLFLSVCLVTLIIKDKVICD